MNLCDLRDASWDKSYSCHDVETFFSCATPRLFGGIPVRFPRSAVGNVDGVWFFPPPVLLQPTVAMALVWIFVLESMFLT
jgi:hypothetical protein